MIKKRNSLAERLNVLLDQAQTQEITFGDLINGLAGKGQAVLLILFSLPFCQPLQIPGFSTPFGLLLAFIGLRIAFGHRIWMPAKLLEKKVSYKVIKKIASFAIGITNKLSFLIYTRMVWLVQNPILHIIHGLVITGLSLILALPLPIPLTNILAAYPILAFGLAILEDDGLMIIIAYILTLICFTFFIGLLWFGKESLSILFVG